MLAEEGTIIVDYKGAVIQKIEEQGVCLCNWAEGFVIGGENARFLRYEEGGYKVKGTFELPDKEA